ncbi:MAG: hypothetical protein J0I90_04610, partial [Nitrosospira sp.]|nr:hypothetical protein [Nitrosospira sp.]
RFQTRFLRQELRSEPDDAFSFWSRAKGNLLVYPPSDRRFLMQMLSGVIGCAITAVFLGDKQ